MILSGEPLDVLLMTGAGIWGPLNEVDNYMASVSAFVD